MKLIPISLVAACLLTACAAPSQPQRPLGPSELERYRCNYESDSKTCSKEELDRWLLMMMAKGNGDWLGPWCDQKDKLLSEANQPGRSDAEVANDLVRIVRREIKAGRLPRAVTTVTRKDGSQMVAWPISDS